MMLPTDATDDDQQKKDSRYGSNAVLLLHSSKSYQIVLHTVTR
ncbi:hypothetical protein [Chitinophaga japonensis]|uniref:Uncharacterized protein n=1 Tax=Chitinophaga japonensis TaxID=104662 RepID=A0A562SMV2_CHIJA|nr:hypothetical protein [Chitinophaga japonensis]TWI82493.1 hypothetical protein LX66_5066 [Chitinophaga japonensis]